MKKPQLINLQNEWYEKLKNDGFDDIETRRGALKKFHSKRFRSATDPYSDPEYLKSKQNYYIRATQFITFFKFESDLEKEIWTLHADGKSFRVIALSIRHKDKGANKDKISGIINRLKIHFKKFVLQPEEHHDENRFDPDKALQA